MKIRLLVILSVLITNVSFAQKLYIWCPEELTTTPRQGFLDKNTIDLAVFDGRILTPKSRVKCTPENTIKQFTEYIKRSYPSAIINTLSADQYYNNPVTDRITIKISISAYHAAFGADVKLGIGNVNGNFSYAVFPEGKWNAITSYAVKIYDYRKGKEIKKTKEIYKTASKPNIGGYLTAKNILNTTYLEATQELLLFIDDTLME